MFTGSAIKALNPNMRIKHQYRHMILAHRTLASSNMVNQEWRFVPKGPKVLFAPIYQRWLRQTLAPNAA
jgi:hypothetical protein